MHARTHTLIASVMLGALALGAGGCREEIADLPPRQFLPDLDDQLKYKAQDESTFFADGRTQRVPPANTVAFGRRVVDDEVAGFTRTGRSITVDFARRAEMLRDDDALYRGRNADGSLVMDIPVPVTRELIELGRENYNIYCIVCHGGTGEGDGIVGQKWSYPIPSYHVVDIQKGGSPEKGSDGYIYDRIRNGVPNPAGTYPYLMTPYNNKVSEHESWAIVAYIRTLQKARSGTMNDLPDRMRLQLQTQAPAAEPATAAVTHTDTTSEEVSS